MRTIVVYDSGSRDSERVARAIAEVLGNGAVAASEAGEMDIEAAELVVVGGTTQLHGLGPQLEAFFDRLPAEGLRGLQAATFDTRTPGHHLSRSTAARIAKALQHRGAQLTASPESFLVAGKELPLLEGELERARLWAVELLEGAQGLAKQRAVGAGLSFAPPGVLRQAGAHFFPAPPITIRWSGTNVHDPRQDEEEDESAGRR